MMGKEKVVIGKVGKGKPAAKAGKKRKNEKSAKDSLENPRAVANQQENPAKRKRKGEKEKTAKKVKVEKEEAGKGGKKSKKKILSQEENTDKVKRLNHYNQIKLINI